MVSRMSQLTMCLVWSTVRRAPIRNVIDDLGGKSRSMSQIRDTIDDVQIWSMIDGVQALLAVEID